MKVVRSTKHFLNEVNFGKKLIIEEFLSEYRKALKICVDYIWSSKLYYKNKLTFSIKDDILNLPTYLNYKNIKNNTKLSARAFCSALEQAISIVRSQIEYRRRYLWLKEKLICENKDLTGINKKLSTIKKLTKPFISNNIGAELSSKCITFYKSSKHFDLFIKLKCSGFDKINFPIQFHKANKKHKKSKLLSGVCLNNNSIILRFEQDILDKTTGITVGADTGIKSVVFLSDGQTPNQTDNHGHSLDLIMKKMSRQKKNSKAFHRTQAQRENFINWSINQINFENIKEVRLEKINTFNGGKRNRFLSHFAHSLTSNKIIRLCEELGVQVVQTQSPLKSQRCFGCGIVHKSNRKGKEYCCSNCNLQIDADYNSALNNEVNLPPIPKWIMISKSNKTGFFWKPEGLFDLEGQALGVPDAIKKDNI